MLNPTDHLRKSLEFVRDTKTEPSGPIFDSDRFSVFHPIAHLLSIFIMQVRRDGKLTRDTSIAAIDALLQILDLQSHGPSSNAMDEAFMLMAGQHYAAEQRIAYVSETCDRAQASNEQLGREVSELNGQITILNARLAAAPDSDPS